MGGGPDGLRVGAMGQTVTDIWTSSTITVRVEVQLPWILSVIAEKAKSFIQKQGTLMLEKKWKRKASSTTKLRRAFEAIGRADSSRVPSLSVVDRSGVRRTALAREAVRRDLHESTFI